MADTKKTDKPKLKSTAAKSAAKSTGTKPAAKSTGTKPDAKSTGTKPAAKSTGTKPAAKSTAKPAAKSTGTKPVAKSTGTKSTGTKSTGTKPAAKPQNKTEPVVNKKDKKVSKIDKAFQEMQGYQQSEIAENQYQEMNLKLIILVTLGLTLIAIGAMIYVSQKGIPSFKKPTEPPTNNVLTLEPVDQAELLKIPLEARQLVNNVYDCSAAIAETEAAVEGEDVEVEEQVEDISNSFGFALTDNGKILRLALLGTIVSDNVSEINIRTVGLTTYVDLTIISDKSDTGSTDETVQGILTISYINGVITNTTLKVNDGTETEDTDTSALLSGEQETDEQTMKCSLKTSEYAAQNSPLSQITE
ncbi:MAG: hypothetical protein LBN03_01375 [Bifidobacteriaceae bacterium]|jgi:hypothetical protein|nr:hypothetical protein [Bifidobacteriaceae bacterium]